MSSIHFHGRQFLTQYASYQEASRALGRAATFRNNATIIANTSITAADESASEPVLLNDKDNALHFTTLGRLRRFLTSNLPKNEQTSPATQAYDDWISDRLFISLLKDFQDPAQLNTQAELDALVETTCQQAQRLAQAADISLIPYKDIE